MNFKTIFSQIKLNEAIKNQDLNNPKMRYIAKNLSKKIENGEDPIAKDLLDFTMKDIEENGKDNEEIKDIDMDTLATLSKFPGLMKQIMKNGKLFKELQKDYNEPELTHKKRGVLSTIFNNASTSEPEAALIASLYFSMNSTCFLYLLLTLMSHPLLNNRLDS